MQFGGPRRELLVRVGEFDDVAAKVHLGVHHQIGTGPGKSQAFPGPKGRFQEVNEFRRSLNDQVRSDGVEAFANVTDRFGFGLSGHG